MYKVTPKIRRDPIRTSGVACERSYSQTFTADAAKTNKAERATSLLLNRIATISDNTARTPHTAETARRLGSNCTAPTIRLICAIYKSVLLRVARSRRSYVIQYPT